MTSLWGELFTWVSLGYFQYFFLLSFKTFPLSRLFCLTSSVSEFRWHIYLSQSWMCVLGWDYPYAVGLCPVALEGQLDLQWVGSVFAPRVCWQLSPWCVMRLEVKGLEPGPGMSWASLYSVTIATLLAVRSGSWGAGAEEACECWVSPISDVDFHLILGCNQGLGLEAALLCWFHFLSSVHALVREAAWHHTTELVPPPLTHVHRE